MAKILKFRSNNIEALKAWVKKNGAWNNSHTSYVCITCNKSFSGAPSAKAKFQAIVDKYQLPYKFVGNGEFLIERKNPDFININGEKKAIEVYARRYKESLRNLSIEKWKRERQAIFSKYGWEIIFFNEVELNESNVLTVLKGGD